MPKPQKATFKARSQTMNRVVDFLDKGLLTRDAIGSDEQAHRAKWPIGSEKVVGEIRIVQEGGLWQAEYTIEFYNGNGDGEWHRGHADLTLRLKEAGKMLSITSQRVKVYDVTNNKQAPTANETWWSREKERSSNCEVGGESLPLAATS